MSQERLAMRKIKEVLRLKWEAGLSNRAIARACKISNSTVSITVRRARDAGLSWPLPAELGEEEIYQRLFPRPTPAADASGRLLPEWAAVRQELSRRGVTLKLLWQEYREKNPEGYRYTQYCEHYRRWSKQVEPSMRRVRVGGEELEVDYAGMTVPVVDPENGETWEAQIFVAALGASGYLYAEAQHSQGLVQWIGGHVQAFTFLGGVPKILRPDNLKSGVKKANYYEPELNPSYLEMAQHYKVAVLPARPWARRSRQAREAKQAASPRSRRRPMPCWRSASRRCGRMPPAQVPARSTGLWQPSPASPWRLAATQHRARRRLRREVEARSWSAEDVLAAFGDDHEP